METNKIKNLAFGARGALRREIAARIDAVLADASPERLDSPDKVCSLEKSIKERGSEEVVDSFAYTWFNRLCALRFMDAKGYTPAGVVTPKEGSSQPAILTDASQGVFDPEWRFDRNVRDRVTSILSGGISAGANPTESAYAVLLDAVCTQYAKSMPYLFDEVAASSLAMPSGLLSEDSILRRIVDDMDDDACESVEVLGWLYQFYISERKDDFFASNRKAAPDDIAPATQLFTPKWIVRYLVQNSLGRLWMLNNPHSNLAASMDYYIAPEGETEDFLRVHSPEELTLCDPACGSGHILVYAFDLLYDIYREEGYPKESIPELILTNNLFGMEIDNRAAEIAKFALEMKAREKDQDFFRRELDANVTVLESVTFDQDELVGTDLSHDINLLDAFAHMTECGSLFVPNGSDVEYVYDAIAKMKDASELFTDVTFAKLTKVKLILTALKRRFACIVANPPYMPVGNMDQWANSWVKSNYPLAKSDLCTCFIMRGFSLSAPRGYSAILTMQAWMFLDSYKKMRSAVLDTKLIISLIQLGSRAFDSIGGEIVSTAASIFHNEQSNKGCHGVYARLTTVVGENGKSELYKRALKEGSSGVLYSIAQSSFSEIPGKPIAYWVTPSVLGIFKKNKPLSNYADTFRGLQPGDVPRFVRGWYEVSSSDIGDCRSGASKWSPLSSGGRDRRWYGNLEKIVFWNRYGDAIKQTGKAIIPNEESYGNLTIGWSRISSGTPAMRLYPKGIVPGDATGNIRCRNAIYQRYALALLNSSVVDAIWPMMNPNMTNSTGIVSKIPFVLNSLSEGDSDIASLVDENVDIGRMDWDAFETSWNFEWHPLAPSVLERSEQLSYGMMTDARIAAVSLVSNRFARWSDECDNRFNKLKANEETLNRIFANIYGMEGEVSIEVPDDKVSVRRADLVRD
ncbi:MAG: BREX-1 system adenine-specific DNA-methyltransferase PglX, partial [Gordonibacter sp.]